MPRLKPPIHGRDHRQGGADPIIDPDVIRYRVHNTGEWLDIATTGTDPDAGGSDTGRGFKVVSSNGIRLENSDTATGFDSLLQLVIGSTLSLVNLSKTLLRLQTHQVLVKFVTGLTTGTPHFTVSSSSGHGDLALFEIDDGGVTTWKFYDASSKIEVKDHTGSVIFSIADDGTVTVPGTLAATLDGGGP